ncbi:MAG TPA: hypothetical protein VIZ60_03820 [Rubrobacter sp.]
MREMMLLLAAVVAVVRIAAATALAARLSHDNSYPLRAVSARTRISQVW